MSALATLSGLGAPPHKRPERVEEERARLAGMSLSGFAGAWHALQQWQGTRERAHALAAPTQVIYGELDAAVREGSQWLAATLPRARLECIAEAGHSPQDERPELFNAALARHLREHAHS